MSDLIASARPVPDNDDAASAAAAELASILALQTGLAAIAALYVAREVIVPVTLAILLSFVLTPLVDLLRAAKLGGSFAMRSGQIITPLRCVRPSTFVSKRQPGYLQTRD
jgi:hypothetical protein